MCPSGPTITAAFVVAVAGVEEVLDDTDDVEVAVVDCRNVSDVREAAVFTVAPVVGIVIGVLVECQFQDIVWEDFTYLVKVVVVLTISIVLFPWAAPQSLKHCFGFWYEQH